MIRLLTQGNVLQRAVRPRGQQLRCKERRHRLQPVERHHLVDCRPGPDPDLTACLVLDPEQDAADRLCKRRQDGCNERFASTARQRMCCRCRASWAACATRPRRWRSRRRIAVMLESAAALQLQSGELTMADTAATELSQTVAEVASNALLTLPSLAGAE